MKLHFWQLILEQSQYIYLKIVTGILFSIKKVINVFVFNYYDTKERVNE